jgi:hypothetical protein
MTLETASNRSAASTGRQWSDSRWEAFNVARLPYKPDPDVLAISKTLRLTYGNAKMLKALSFGIPVQSDLLAWCAGRGMDASEGARAVCCIRNIVKIECIRNHHPILYVIHDEESLMLIRNAMVSR